ncbi:amidohydrolase family protein [Kaistia dalseonensis]|uniref:TIM-barrel fold metal-dependent hydrolase n=1 Tax=Kaistia dalseonensis TaxID=410840 RepID=A0ABU0H9U2_9HYPH|nr:amidohydrolase family protein [Kaistia dalseonensis]MCX5496153.1 amidohydrolase family protein [Kaistia dalseonensis]MDQ0438762.1 putative TIM-barrel fold metal-dependent hydrolase [Kaistia dalseonensis]
MALYDGPIIDAHHHLWTFDAAELPWLAAEANAPLARDFGAEDYGTAAGDLPIVATVWIEALARSSEREALAACAVRRRTLWLCNALVAHAPLDAPDIADRLDALRAALPRLRGIRDIVAVRRGANSFARRPDLLERPEFLEGLRALAERNLAFDLMLEPWQMKDALRLVKRLPGLQFIIEHAGSPDFSSDEGAALWQGAMKAAAAYPNVAVKISALHCRMPGWTDERLAGPIRALVDWFGVDRLAFASDFPVHDLSCPFRRAFETLGRAVAVLSPAAQRALFHDTAQALYRI